MIVWLFKEWFLHLEARHESNSKTNFVSMFNQVIGPFLQKLSDYAATKPSFMDAANVNKLHEYLANPNALFDDLQELVKSEYFATVYSDRNYSLAFTNAYEATTKRYTMDGPKYKFEKYENFNSYLGEAGKEKSVHGAEEKKLNNLTELLRYIFHDTLFASWTREARRMRSAPTSSSKDGGDRDLEMGEESKVTRKRDSESEALLKIGPLYECIKSLYGKIAEKLRDECEGFIEEVNNLSENPDTIKNLGNIKKTLHQLAIAEFISGKRQSSSTEEIGDDYLTHMDISSALSPSYQDRMGVYKNNLLKTTLLKKEKISQFLDDQKFKDSEMDNLMKTVIGYLYYIAILKNMEKSPDNPNKKRDVSPEMKREMRSAYLSMLPSDVKMNITDENLKEFSTMSVRQLPLISYTATIDQLSSTNFEDLYKELMLSYEFPTNYNVYKKDEFGGLDISATKDDLIKNLLSPIYELLINQSIDAYQFYDDDENLDCDKLLAYFRKTGLI